jgi:hypothetical protein
MFTDLEYRCRVASNSVSYSGDSAIETLPGDSNLFSNSRKTLGLYFEVGP